MSVPTVFIFTTLTLIATLVHRDKFHFGAENQFSTRLVTWIWLAIYVVVPVLMVVLTVVQMRQPGVDPPRDRPLPTPLMVIVGVQALVFIAMGAALFVAPERASGWWPWTLTPLTGRAIGAWVFSLGIAAAHSLWERDASPGPPRRPRGCDVLRAPGPRSDPTRRRRRLGQARLDRLRGGARHVVRRRPVGPVGREGSADGRRAPLDLTAAQPDL